MPFFRTVSFLRSKPLPYWLKKGLSDKKLSKSRAAMRKIGVYAQMEDETKVSSGQGHSFSFIPLVYEENALLADSFNARLFQCIQPNGHELEPELSMLSKAFISNSVPKGCIGWADINLYFLNGERKHTILVENLSQPAHISTLPENTRQKLGNWIMPLANYAQTKLKNDKVRRIAIHSNLPETEITLSKNGWAKQTLELKNLHGEIAQKECWVKER